eukprot:TRINITY_DN9283_c0_g2_i1.p2 TRINITY_DN9283_c0_g2~~TRINITY_DN9283_c0_g2_i1.p2  ORF type:complete len:160 (+),score=58.59 TRINITY_DN9283_c0_g2_i1:685-1164(+)
MAKLRSKYEVYFVCRVPTTHGQEGGDIPRHMQNKYNEYFGEGRTLRLKTAKAVVDIMLGAISISSGARSWAEYIEDMKERGQTEERIDEVHWAFRRPREQGSGPAVAATPAPVSKGARGGGGGESLSAEQVREVARLFVLKQAGALTAAEFESAKTLVL